MHHEGFLQETEMRRCFNLLRIPTVDVTSNGTNGELPRMNTFLYVLHIRFVVVVLYQSMQPWLLLKKGVGEEASLRPILVQQTLPCMKINLCVLDVQMPTR